MSRGKTEIKNRSLQLIQQYQIPAAPPESFFAFTDFKYSYSRTLQILELFLSDRKLLKTRKTSYMKRNLLKNMNRFLK